MAPVYIRCDGCGEFHPSPTIVLTMLHALAFRYCVVCDRLRVHHPGEVVISGMAS
jgi:hypothetical protein